MNFSSSFGVPPSSYSRFATGTRGVRDCAHGSPQMPTRPPGAGGAGMWRSGSHSSLHWRAGWTSRGVRRPSGGSAYDGLGYAVSKGSSRVWNRTAPRDAITRAWSEHAQGLPRNAAGSADSRGAARGSQSLVSNDDDRNPPAAHWPLKDAPPWPSPLTAKS